jgi:hypothetical protein
MVIEYIKNEWKEMLRALLVGFIIFGIYSSYIYFVGRPMTLAKNQFNKGLILYEKGDYMNAKEYFVESDKIWETDENNTYLAKVTSYP